MACLLSASSAASDISTRNGSIADEAAGTTGVLVWVVARAQFVRAAVALNLKGKSKPKPRRASSKRAD
jgi:hypothetical protein